MKITTKTLPYDDVMRLPRTPHRAPIVPNAFFRALMRNLGAGDLKDANFSYTEEGTERVESDAHRLVLMNHSAFIDLEIAATILHERPFNIVCTKDGFVGKEWLMRQLGCIPTRKFVTDLTLIRDMKTALAHADVLMFPEAGYSLDGTATVLQRRLGKLLKMLDCPVMTIRTHGAFLRDPLYNCLQKRKVTVTADYRCLFTREEVRTLPEHTLNDALDEFFTFDNFAEQKADGIRVTESFRADGLHRILYKCPHCGAEGRTEGKGTHLVCHACGKEWELTELGELLAAEGETEYTSVPAWFAWERAEVRRELEAGTYSLDTECEVGVIVDAKALYMVGRGRLRHDAKGFRLTGTDETDRTLDYKQSPLASYGLNADYFWYEIGDIIGIGDRNALYYCFPPADVPVAKARLAAEELFRITKEKQLAEPEEIER